MTETCSELNLLLERKARHGDRKIEDRISWKPEVSFMAGSFEGPVRETSHTAHTSNYVPSHLTFSYAWVAFSAIPLS